MMMSPALRKLALTTHVTVSVGWIGAVAAFSALALAGLISLDPQIHQVAYAAMELITWWVIVPFCLASFVSGVISSLGTEWGLFRHYWVIVKLVITVVATFGLLVHTQAISQLSRADASDENMSPLRIQILVAAALALLALTVANVLSIYKPRGLTPYGWRKQQEQRLSQRRSRKPQPSPLSESP